MLKTSEEGTVILRAKFSSEDQAPGDKLILKLLYFTLTTTTIEVKSQTRHWEQKPFSSKLFCNQFITALGMIVNYNSGEDCLKYVTNDRRAFVGKVAIGFLTAAGTGQINLCLGTKQERFL